MLILYEEFIDRSDISLKEKMILIQMARFKLAHAPVNQTTLHTTLGLARVTVKRTLDELEKREIIKSKKDYSIYNFGTTIYSFNIPISPQITEHVKQTHTILLPGHILEYLSEVTGESYIMTNEIRELIECRIKEGFKYEQFKKVIDLCYMAWKGTSFENNLNPLYLFNDDFYKRLKY